MLLSGNGARAGKNRRITPFYGFDTDFPPMLSTINFRKFIQIPINVFFIPEDLRKDFLGWDRKFTGIKFIPDRLRPQTYIIDQFIEIHHSFFKFFHHLLPPQKGHGERNIVFFWPERPVI
jgi:hypothetical protein